MVRVHHCPPNCSLHTSHGRAKGGGHLKRWCKGSTAVLQTAGTGSNPVRFSTRIAIGPGLFILLEAGSLLSWLPANSTLRGGVKVA